MASDIGYCRKCIKSRRVGVSLFQKGVTDMERERHAVDTVVLGFPERNSGDCVALRVDK